MGFMLATVAGCVEAPAGQGRETADATMQWQGIRSQVVEESTVVARSGDQWAALWQRVGSRVPAALPDDTVAVGMFLGQRRTAGYRIEIVSAARSGADFAIVYRERRPMGPAAMVITYPYLIRLFPDPGVEITVEKRR